MSEGEQSVAREWAPAIKELGDKISQLTLVQGKELADYLKEAYGIEPAAGGAVMIAPQGAAGAQAAPEEPSTFDVVLTEIGPRKINVIKAVREETGLGLKEAKDLVEAVPSKIKEGLPKDDAQKLKTKLEEQGAKVELK